MNERCGSPSISGRPATAGKTAQAPVVSRKPWRRSSSGGPAPAQATAMPAPVTMVMTAVSANSRAFGLPS